MAVQTMHNVGGVCVEMSEYRLCVGVCVCVSVGVCVIDRRKVN